MNLHAEQEWAEESKKEMEEFFDKYRKESIKQMDQDEEFIREQENGKERSERINRAIND